jgi:hypothetical protein
MEPTLDEALADLFGAQQPQNPRPQNSGATAASQPHLQPPPQLGEARSQLEAAQKAMKQGDWDAFGKAMQSLERTLSTTQ